MKTATRNWIVLLFAAVLFLPLNSAAAAEPSSSLSEILRKVEQQYQQMQAFVATFHQSTASSAANSMTTEATGKLYYQKPRQMRWDYEKPEQQTFVASRDLAWLYVPSEKQASIFDSKTLFASPLAQTFFDGFVELRKNFEVAMDSRQSTKSTAVLKLTPRAEDPNVKYIVLTIDLKTYRITSIETTDALGNTNRIMLDSQRTVPSLDSSLFQFDIPPSTVVLDAEGREVPPAEIEKLKKQATP